MFESSSVEINSANKIGRNGLHRSATDCTTKSEYARASARGIWKSKTAACWAAAAGVQVRMAKYWLAGHEVSETGRMAIIRLLA